MIQLQKSDQLSGTMQESLFAGSIVITGSWLPYQVLQDEGVYFKSISEFSELPGKLFEIIQNLNKENQKCSRNRSIIHRFSSWEYTINDWLLAYQSERS